MAGGDIFSNIRGFAPREILEFLEQISLLLPEELRYRLKQVIEALPPEGDNLQKVLELVRSQWKDIQCQESARITVAGPPHTGKSSLLGKILGSGAGLESSIFSVVDLEGLEEYLGFESRSAALEELKQADVLLLVLDGRYGISDATVQLYEFLAVLGRPLLVVLNKMDLVDNPAAVVRVARRRLKANLFPTSLHREGAVDTLLKAVVAANPRTLYPLTQAFPEFRRTICNSVVTQSAFSAGVIGAIPIPVSDLLPITAIQTAMLLKIARAFGHQLNRERARELLPMLGLGALVREGSHRLRRRFPDQKGLIAVSLAGLWTWALGRLAIGYFERVSRYLETGSLQSHLAEVGS